MKTNDIDSIKKLLPSLPIEERIATIREVITRTEFPERHMEQIKIFFDSLPKKNVADLIENTLYRRLEGSGDLPMLHKIVEHTILRPKTSGHNTFKWPSSAPIASPFKATPVKVAAPTESKKEKKGEHTKDRKRPPH